MAFQLNLPKSLKIHPVFHVSLFKPKDTDILTIPTPPPPDPVTIDGELEYEVEAILDSKKFFNTVKYLIHWKGYDKNQRTWEPFSSITNSNKLLHEFHTRNPSKPRAVETLTQSF